MNELTRYEKVRKLMGLVEIDIYKTDQEINELYKEHFEKITEQDFEGFEKVCKKFVNVLIVVNAEDGKEIYWRMDTDLKEIKKELGL